MIIRRIEEKDLPVRVEWMNHPKVYSSMHYAIPVVLDKTVAWFKQNLDNENRVDVVFECDGELVAMGGLTGIDGPIGKAELYIFVDPFIHSKGIGTTATTLLCEYGFKSLDLTKIYLVTNESNIAAQRVYEKVGFKLEGRLRKEAMVAGKLEDRLYYGLLKDELRQL
jgi:diamine N-acetyltransferase